jgi:hypothetical protein
MTTSDRIEKPFTANFIDAEPGLLLQLTNTTDRSLKSVEILTIFLKDEDTPGGPSRAHIRFESIKNIQPREKAVTAHKTLLDGRLVDRDQDQLGRLQVVAGEIKPYVLDISWEDAEGKMGYQRIPVGH